MRRIWYVLDKNGNRIGRVRAPSYTRALLAARDRHPMGCAAVVPA